MGELSPSLACIAFAYQPQNYRAGRDSGARAGKPPITLTSKGPSNGGGVVVLSWKLFRGEHLFHGFFIFAFIMDEDSPHGWLRTSLP